VSFDRSVTLGEGLNAQTESIFLPFLSRKRIARPSVKYEAHAFILPDINALPNLRKANAHDPACPLSSVRSAHSAPCPTGRSGSAWFACLRYANAHRLTADSAGVEQENIRMFLRRNRWTACCPSVGLVGREGTPCAT